MTALEVLKKVRSEMRPNAKAGEYELPVIIKAMHDFAALCQLPVIKSVCDVCGSGDVIEVPHMGKNCNRCHPL